MTIPYRHQFLQSLLLWKGSMWAVAWKDLSVFLLLFYAINIPLRFTLSDKQLATFKDVRDTVDKKLGSYNLIFILGFFLSHIVSRWWQQFELVSSSPFAFISSITAHVREGEHMDAELARNRRFCIMRWTILMTILGWIRHSVRIKKRFPTVDHLVTAKIATEEEAQMLKDSAKQTTFGNWWQPCIWIHNLISIMLREGSIDSVVAVSMETQLEQYRSKVGGLMRYHWVPIPLPYTQLVTSATYGYFMIDLITHQTFHSDTVDTYIPLFFIIKFILFVGTLRVSEEIIDPFGEDCDDFEVNWLLDWNVNTSRMQIDALHDQLPHIKPNPWATGNRQQGDVVLNHTIGSNKIQSNPLLSRVNKWTKLTAEDMIILDENLYFSTAKSRSSSDCFNLKRLNKLTVKKDEKFTNCLSPDSNEIGASTIKL